MAIVVQGALATSLQGGSPCEVLKSAIAGAAFGYLGANIGAAFEAVSVTGAQAAIRTGALTGALGPLGVVAFLPLPPVSAAGVNLNHSVTVAVNNSAVAATCPGAVYLAWSDMATGNPDIIFTSSFDGGLTWTPAIVANQDFTGRDQWARKRGAH